jgi:PAP2 superfamily
VRRVIVHGVIAVLAWGPGPGPASAQTDPAPPAVAAGSATPATPIEGGGAARFLRDVAGDYKHFISKETAVWLGAGGGAALAVHTADEWIAGRVQESNPVELTGGWTYGSMWLHIPVALAVWTVGAAADSDLAETGRDLLRGQISVVSWTYAIKLTADRTRPDGQPRSFPSGHTSTSFATAMVLQEHFGWKAGLPAFGAAAYSGISRITGNRHWASDVVFGAAVGLSSGRTVTLHLRNTRFSFAPLAVPGGSGVLVTALRTS